MMVQLDSFQKFFGFHPFSCHCGELFSGPVFMGFYGLSCSVIHFVGIFVASESCLQKPSSESLKFFNRILDAFISFVLKLVPKHITPSEKLIQKMISFLV